MYKCDGDQIIEILPLNCDCIDNFDHDNMVGYGRSSVNESDRRDLLPLVISVADYR